MVKEEIVEGIKVALEKGQNLKDAMMSFFNAGYPREEINDAAREVLSMKDSSGNRIYSNDGKIDNSKNMHAQNQVPLAPGNQPNISRAPQNNFNNQFQQQMPTQFGQNNFQQNESMTNQQNFNQFPQQNQPSFGQAYSQQQTSQNQFNQQRNFPQQQNNFQQNQSMTNQQRFQGQNNFQQNPSTTNQFSMQNNSQQGFGMQRKQNPFMNQNAENTNTPALVAPMPPTTPQKVSDYSGEKKSSSGKGILFFFLFLFLVLIAGGIAGLVFFKEEIFSFLGI